MYKFYCLRTFDSGKCEYYTKGKIYEIDEVETETSFYIKSNYNTIPCIFTTEPDKEPFLDLYDYFKPIEEIREDKIKELLCL